MEVFWKFKESVAAPTTRMWTVCGISKGHFCIYHLEHVCEIYSSWQIIWSESSVRIAGQLCQFTKEQITQRKQHILECCVSFITYYSWRTVFCNSLTAFICFEYLEDLNVLSHWSLIRFLVLPKKRGECIQWTLHEVKIWKIQGSNSISYLHYYYTIWFSCINVYAILYLKCIGHFPLKYLHLQSSFY